VVQTLTRVSVVILRGSPFGPKGTSQEHISRRRTAAKKGNGVPASAKRTDYGGTNNRRSEEEKKKNQRDAAIKQRPLKRCVNRKRRLGRSSPHVASKRWKKKEKKVFSDVFRIL